MKNIGPLLITILLFNLASSYAQEARDYYQVKIYQIDSKDQENRLDQYLKNAYLPALHRAGIESVGVFKPIEGKNGEEKFVMVFTPFTSLQGFEDLSATLAGDEVYLKDGKDYIGASHDNPPYKRIESMLLKSFSAMPRFALPELSTDPSQRVYEFRSYEGATEQL